eukprot:gene23687-26804_t
MTIKIGDKLPADLSNTISWLADAKSKLGQLNEAKALYQREEELLLPLHSSAPSDALWTYRIANAMVFQSELLLAMGQQHEARVKLRNAESLMREVVRLDASNRHWQVNLYATQSKLYALDSELGNAAESLPKQLALREKLAALPSPDRKPPTDRMLQKKVQVAEVARSPAAVHQYLTDYVVKTFPSVFSNKPFFSRLYGEVKRHHRYLTLFTAPEGESGDKQRILTGVQLLSTQTMLMFLLAMLYDVESPSDDGSCLTYIDTATCLNRKSVFDTTVSYCDWHYDPLNDADGCFYRNP